MRSLGHPVGAPEPVDEPSDEALVARAAHGDVAAFEVLYDRYVRLVYALAARSLGPAAAEEIVQDVFLQLWRSAGQFDPTRGSFGPWLTAIARHRVIREFGALGRERRLIASAQIDGLLAELPASDPAVEELSERSEVAWETRRAIQTLPPEQRRAIVLAYFGGMSQSAIANHLGIPLGTVKKRIRLGMQKLRVGLAMQGEHQDEPAVTLEPRGIDGWRGSR
jgi:RNA polymerase sigma-70 factor, ECF subfamily